MPKKKNPHGNYTLEMSDYMVYDLHPSKTVTKKLVKEEEKKNQSSQGSILEGELVRCVV